MSLTERLRTMELLWESLAENPAQVDSPDWHGRVLSERLTRVSEGSAKFLTLEEVQHWVVRNRRA